MAHESSRKSVVRSFGLVRDSSRPGRPKVISTAGAANEFRSLRHLCPDDKTEKATASRRAFFLMSVMGDFYANRCVITGGCSRPGSDSTSKTEPMMPTKMTSVTCR